MTNTIFHDKSMLSLVLIVAFFVGASATNAFMDDAFAGNHGNNGNNGCENANPNAKACENNPNTDPVKTIKITTIFNGSPIPDASCLLVDISGTVVAGGSDRC